MQIFFSYARDDAAFALQLASDLRNGGAQLWIDQLDISPGEHWDKAIEAALKSCPAFLVILSPRSVSSSNVSDEVHYALEEGKKILPVMYQACELPFRLRRLQYIDFTKDYKASLTACIAHVKTLFGEAVASETAAKPMKPADSTAEAAREDELIRSQSRERLNGTRFLWVDDRPSNNRYERKALEELGAEIHLAIDTNDAILITNEIAFDLIISDMGRPSDQRAGYALLSKLRKMNVNVPFIIYAGSSSPEYTKEAIRAGAVGYTDNPHDLLEMILTAVGNSNPRLSKRPTAP
ncbi:MAG TPA: TIR domain-containing protein [Xanthobacteraceae bacterium]